MADEEHLAKLKQGIAAWNVWREEKPDVRPDLTWADLRGVTLFADVGDANVRRVNLSNVNLSKAAYWTGDRRRG